MIIHKSGIFIEFGNMENFVRIVNESISDMEKV